MNIVFKGHASAEIFVLDDRNVWDVIWIHNSGTTVPIPVRNNARATMGIIFDDIDCPLDNYIMPTQLDVQIALGFAEDKNNLLISCVNGITRSAAIAYLCKCQQCENPEEAIKILVPGKNYPNKRVIEFGEKILKDPRIGITFNNWIKKHN